MFLQPGVGLARMWRGEQAASGRVGSKAKRTLSDI